MANFTNFPIKERNLFNLNNEQILRYLKTFSDHKISFWKEGAHLFTMHRFDEGLQIKLIWNMHHPEQVGFVEAGEINFNNYFTIFHLLSLIEQQFISLEGYTFNSYTIFEFTPDNSLYNAFSTIFAENRAAIGKEDYYKLEFELQNPSIIEDNNENYYFLDIIMDDFFASIDNLVKFREYLRSKGIDID